MPALRGQAQAGSEPPLPSNKDQIFVGVGRKRPAPGWQPGRYSATYRVLRDGSMAVEKTFSADVAP